MKKVLQILPIMFLKNFQVKTKQLAKPSNKTYLLWNAKNGVRFGSWWGIYGSNKEKEKISYLLIDESSLVP